MSKQKIQISPLQLTFLSITMVVSTADIFTPSFVAQDAKRDSWLSAILASLAMIPVLLIQLGLYKQYKGKCLTEICIEIAGNFPGRIIAFLYSFYFIFVAIGAAVSLTIVLNITFLPLTPPWVIVVVSILVAMYGVYSGLEVIARVNEILLPAGMGALVFLLILNIGEYDFNYFRPVFEQGILQPIRGAVVIFGYLCETVGLLQMFHLVSKQEKVNLAAFIGLLITGSAMLAGTLIYAVFGPLTEIFVIPALEMARFSSIGKYIQNLDVLILAIWITGIYVKLMIYTYSGTYAMSVIFGLKNYKYVVLPVGFFICGVTISGLETVITELDFMHYIVPVYAIFMAVIIPGVLLLISKIIKRRKGEEPQK